MPEILRILRSSVRTAYPSGPDPAGTGLAHHRHPVNVSGFNAYTT